MDKHGAESIPAWTTNFTIEEIPGIVDIAYTVLQKWHTLSRLLDDAEQAEAAQLSVKTMIRHGTKIRAGLDRLSTSWKTLRDQFDTIAEYWVGDQPPSFNPSASSVLEGIIWLTRQFSMYLEFSWKAYDGSAQSSEPGHGPVERNATWCAVAAFVRRHCPRPDIDQVLAAIRCEAAKMQVRCREGDSSIALSPRIRDRLTWTIEWKLVAEFSEHLPNGWGSMTDAERIAALSPSMHQQLAPAHRPGRPRDEDIPKIAARACELYDTPSPRMTWKEVTAQVNIEFPGRDYATPTVRRYVKIYRGQWERNGG